MKISYVATIRFPTEKAHGYQIARVCGELALLGHSVTLYVPVRTNTIQEDSFAFYGIEQNFKVVVVPSPDYMRFVRYLGQLAFFLSERAFLHRLSLPLDAVVYTRDATTVDYLSKRGYSCVYNAHNWSSSRARRLTRARGVVCNSHGTEAAVRSALTVPTLVAYNATDPNLFVGADKIQLRKELDLPQEGAIAMYTGHLYGWKGMDVLLECARALAGGPSLHLVIVGGTKEDIHTARERAEGLENIVFLGYQPKALISKYTAAADVLLLPNTAMTEESVRYTSPLKLFEYMASGVPIVASDLPSLREILSEQSAFLVHSGDVDAFVTAIRRALADTAEARIRATGALREASFHTWRAHAEQVAAFIAKVV